jgi:AcrR family transcriptional regulator
MPSAPDPSPRPTTHLTTRDRQRLETRDRIYEAGLAEFRRVGVGSAQIDAITRRAGVARGTFYVHFSSKDDLLGELQRRIEARVLERLAARDLADASLREVLGRVCAAILDEDEDPALLREVMANVVRAPGDAGWADNAYFGPISEHLARVQERGGLRDDCDASEVTGVFMTSLFGFLTGSSRPPRERRASITRLLDFFIDGVAPRDPGGPR